jgi:hypothetical protein
MREVRLKDIKRETDESIREGSRDFAYGEGEVGGCLGEDQWT